MERYFTLCLGDATKTLNITNNIMKKYTFLLLFIFILAGRIGTAQNLSFGPMAGFNVSNLSGKEDTKSKVGLVAGGFFNYSSKNWFGVGVQILYSQLGAKLSASTDAINLNYLQVPILFTYYLSGDNSVGSFRPKLFLGPHVNFLLNAKNNAGADLNTNSAFYKSTELGVTLGGGFNYALADKIWLNFDVRYGVGLTDAKQSPNVDVSNRALGVNLGVSFPIGDI